MRNFVYTILCLFLVPVSGFSIDVWDGSSEIWSNGTGTETDPYQLESSKHLAFLSNYSGNDYENSYFVLTEDLDLNNKAWNPICAKIASFDGKNHNVSNVWVTGSISYGGLFGTSIAVIKNVRVFVNVSSLGYSGGVVGYTSGDIINCSCSGSVSSGGYSGGIAGYCMGNVINCNNSSEVRTSNGGNINGFTGYSGGIVGYSTGKIKCCSNTGGVTTYGGSWVYGTIKSYSGGVAGFSSGEVKYCYNRGAITATGEGRWGGEVLRAGGCVGNGSASTIHSCYNVGKVTYGVCASDNGGTTCSNSYYLIGNSSSSGYGISKSASDMRSQDFPTILNDEDVMFFFQDKGLINDGYPIFEWQGVCSIVFENYNGDELQSEELAYGDMPTYKGLTPIKPADVQYTYTFSGWEPEIAEVTGPQTYIAQFTSKKNKYEIMFVNYNGDELQSEELEYGVTPVYKGSTPVKPADAQYTYTFSGWNPEIVGVTEAKTYTAQFSNTTNKYTVRFLNDDGDVLQSESLDYGSTPVYKGSEPTKPATAQYTYTFNGWDKAITTVTEATDYTATYSSTVNKYEIKFVNYNGEELQSEELEYGTTPEYKGSTPVKPSDAEHTYTFIGWEPEITEVVGVQTYTAQFSNTTNKYPVRFLNDNGEVLQSESLDYGDTPEYKGSEPTKPATAQYTYAFAGWDKTITTVTEATDYTATYSSVVNKYEIKFVNYNGDELQSEELEYGATPEYKGSIPVKPSDAEHTYTFIGWEPEITEVAGSKTYAAQFSSTTNKYEVKTIAQTEGVTTGDGVYDYGETATLTATPNEGYELFGWSNGKTSAVINIVVTKDTTLTAYFQFKPCTVEKDIEVSVPENGELTLKSGKTIIVTKSQRIDDLKVTPLKCDSLFHYNITMIRQSADNTPECDNAPSVAKYDWLFMINVKTLNSLGYTFSEDNVSWYRVVGTVDNIDDPASMHTDQLVGKGYGYTIDMSFIGTGDYYALIDLPRQTSDVGCKGIMRTQVFRYGASKRSAPAVIPTIARPNQRMQVMHLPQEENCEVYIYDNVGKLCRQFASHGTDTAEFEAELSPGTYIVVIKSADGTESVKYIVK